MGQRVVVTHGALLAAFAVAIAGQTGPDITIRDDKTTRNSTLKPNEPRPAPRLDNIPYWRRFERKRHR
jgi:hypothetical protein